MARRCEWLQVLSFALKPRALWVAAHHLDLSGRMDGLWSALLNAVADLVSGNEAEVDARRYTLLCLSHIWTLTRDLKGI